MPTGLRTRAGAGPAVGALIAALAAGVVLASIAGSSSGEDALNVTVHALGIGLPIGLGAFRLSRRRDDAFALALVAVGLLWALASLAESGESVPYSVGRVAAWLVELGLVYLMLAFPSGRLEAKADRLVVGALAVVLAVLYLPSALLVSDYPEPSPWATCGTDCPGNAFALVDSTPGIVDDFLSPLREALTVLVFGAAAALLLRRARYAEPLAHAVMGALAGIAVFRVAALAVFFSARAADTASPLIEVLGWIYLLCLPAITLCFVVGLLAQRLFAADALKRLSVNLAPHGGAAEVRAALADALGDPSLRVVYWLGGDPGRWVDDTGWPIAAPTPEPGRMVTEVTADGRRLAAIVHAADLSRDPELVQAAASHALAALENERLIGELRASLGALADSRARLVAVADRERQRIERDLHDGAQQRLVALRIKLGLMAERLAEGAADEAEAVRKLEQEVEETIDEVRSFARGIYPALLADRGLEAALRAAARGAPLPTTVDVDGIGRYAPEIEAAVYYACREALQNAAKHARGATAVTISVWHRDRLRFEVHDDGAGFDTSRTNGGTGLGHLRDRVEAVDGELAIASGVDGTDVRGSIPAARLSAAVTSAR